MRKVAGTGPAHSRRAAWREIFHPHLVIQHKIRIIAAQSAASTAVNVHLPAIAQLATLTPTTMHARAANWIRKRIEYNLTQLKKTPCASTCKRRIHRPDLPRCVHMQARMAPKKVFQTQIGSARRIRRPSMKRARTGDRGRQMSNPARTSKRSNVVAQSNARVGVVLGRASCAVTVRLKAKNLRNERAPVPSCDAVLGSWCDQ